MRLDALTNCNKSRKDPLQQQTQQLNAFSDNGTLLKIANI